MRLKLLWPGKKVGILTKGDVIEGWERDDNKGVEHGRESTTDIRCRNRKRTNRWTDWFWDRKRIRNHDETNRVKNKARTIFWIKGKLTERNKLRARCGLLIPW